jgi:Flp pilus assembly pilin Flp
LSLDSIAADADTRIVATAPIRDRRYAAVAWAPIAALSKSKEQGDSPMTCIARLLGDESGATSIEYAAIASLISIVAIGAFVTLGTTVDTMFGSIVSAF